MKINLARLEARLQSLIEGSAARIFSFGNRQVDLGARLVNAMQTGIHTQADGSIWAPNLYKLVAHPAQAQVLQDHQAFLREMSQVILQAGSEAGVRFPSPPSIKVFAEPGMDPKEISILALYDLEHLVETSDLETNWVDSARETTPNAFLIVGSEVFPLNGSAVNIGRSTENHLVLEDLRVSRSHAQLRYINGKYVIFDLGSMGGTYVNDQRVQQSLLYPGDVISLAGIPLIFGLEQGAASDTQKFDPDADLPSPGVSDGPPGYPEGKA